LRGGADGPATRRVRDTRSDRRGGAPPPEFRPAVKFAGRLAPVVRGSQ